MFIITSQGWLSPTRATGLVAYGTAVTCCGIAWIRTKARRRTSRLAAVLTLIESALLLDMAFNWRWKLHQALLDIAIRKHEYAQRRLPQLIVVILLGAAATFRVVCRPCTPFVAGARLYSRYREPCCRWSCGVSRWCLFIPWTTFSTIR